MTREEFKIYEKIMRQAAEAIKILYFIDIELGRSKFEMYNPSEENLVNSMLRSMFASEDTAREIEDNLRFDFCFDKEIKPFIESITHNDKSFPEILSLCREKGICAYASSRLSKNLIDARKNFLLDLKKTLEEVLATIQLPKVEENK